MWECWNAVQITSNSKSFGHTANHVAGIYLLTPLDFFKLSVFSLCQFYYSESQNSDEKGPHSFVLLRPKR